MLYIDIAIIIILIWGFLVGFKNGFFRSSINLIATILALVISYALKNPVSVFFYKYLPFMEFSGKVEGLQVINIIIYEAIAFFLVFGLISIGLKIIFMITKLLDKLISLTIVLTLPSKLLGALIGAIESFVFIFVILFLLSTFKSDKFNIDDTKLGNPILYKNPYITKYVSNVTNTVTKIYDLAEEYDEIEDKNEYNLKAMDIILKNKIITVDNALMLVKKDKLQIDGIEELIERYEV